MTPIFGERGVWRRVAISVKQLLEPFRLPCYGFAKLPSGSSSATSARVAGPLQQTCRAKEIDHNGRTTSRLSRSLAPQPRDHAGTLQAIEHRNGESLASDLRRPKLRQATSRVCGSDPNI